jgi:dGTPase
MESTQGYDEASCARWVNEPPKRAERTPFERDRARLVHSAALRRLAAKTQVVDPQTDDFVRNRLTHTLEVAQVARDLAKVLGCDPDVVETAALAHDVAAACGGFEGNAQTLRILTRLEAKSTAPDGRSVGLNLTRATLDASTKYPWPRARAAAPRGVDADPEFLPSVRKFGVYDDDLPVFTWMREPAEPGHRCLEAQVMDLADDVAYSVHDLEDGIVAGRIEVVWLEDPARRREVWQTVREWYLPDVVDDELDAALTGLQALPSWPSGTFDGSRRAQAALKNLTSDLIGAFCTSVQHATHDKYGTDPLTRYAADLVVPRETALAIAVLKGVAAQYVMRAADRVTLMAEQREVLAELVDTLATSGRAHLEPAFRADHDQAGSDAERLRVVVDQVASLTDASAAQWHHRLVGSRG